MAVRHVTILGLGPGGRHSQRTHLGHASGTFAAASALWLALLVAARLPFGITRWLPGNSQALGRVATMPLLLVAAFELWTEIGRYLPAPDSWRVLGRQANSFAPQGRTRAASTEVTSIVTRP